MLTALRDALAAHDGGPVRIDRLARQLGSDPATVTAMLDHARRRGLVTASTGVATGAAADCTNPGASACAVSTPACRHCPLAVPAPR
jgi:DNA-binding IclR family transcriptional regulator